MSGLLGALDGLSASVDVSVTLQPQAEALEAITAAVAVLSRGPQALADIEGALGALPVAPALTGLGALAPALELARGAIPADFSGPLAGLTAPLVALSGSIAASPAGQMGCLVGLLREVLRIVTGRSFGGPEGMPDAGGIPSGELPELAEIEALLAQAGAALDGLGPGLDAARVLAFLQQIAPAADKMLVRFPPIPVLQDLIEALATVARWQAMPGPELTAHLAATIRTAAQLIDLPHTRVVRDRVAAADTVAGGAATLATVNADLADLFAGLRDAVATGQARPHPQQLDRIEAAAARVGALARAMDPARSPLADTEGLVCDLVEMRLLTLRTLQPQCAGLAFGAQLHGWLGGLPAAEADSFAEVVAVIEAFDLSALTDALGTIRDAVQDAVAAVEAARDGVRAQIVALLEPIAAGLDSAIDAAGLAEVQAALAALPGQIRQAVDDTIVANLAGVRDGIAQAVGAISTAADSFDPETLVAPIRDAIGQLGALVNDPQVLAAFRDVEAALDSALAAISGFDLAPAADESIALIGRIEGTLDGIDPAKIPDPAKPLIAQAVAVVADIEFSAEVSAPLERTLGAALEAGPLQVLGALEAAMDAARQGLEGFRPSAIVGATLDAPFAEALALVETAAPDALFGRIEAALAGVQARVQILDVGAVVDPLAAAHGGLSAEIARLRPSALLQPVDDALAAAIARVYEAAGLDTAFDGLNGLLAEINRYVGLIAGVRDLLARVAGLLDTPGDAGAEIGGIVEAALARLDAVEMAGLAEAFALAGAAVQRTGRDAVAGALARGFRAAGQAGPALGGHAEVARLNALLDAFPHDAARRLRPGPARDRLVAALTRLRSDARALRATSAPWAAIGPRLEARAGSIQLDLKEYHLAGRVEDASVLASFATPPATTDALKAEVRRALEEGLVPPVTAILAVFAALAPHVQVAVRGLSDILGAVHGRIDAIAGAGGIGGTVQDVETVVNLLREVDLAPVTEPLDALHARIEGALSAVSPEALRPLLEAARDAVAGLVELSLLVDPADRQALVAAHAAVLAKLRGLSPSQLVGAPLDAEYEALLGAVLPILDMPARLRAAVLEARLELSAGITAELARVEAAFDAMLRAIPLRTGVAVGGSASVSVSVSGG